MNKNVIIAQSGGPTAAINATLAGIISGAISNKIENIYGSLYGIEGLLKDDIISLNEFKDEEKLNQLAFTPAAYLGSCRVKLKLDDYEKFDVIFKNFEKYNIGYFLYIGGNDSMNTVLCLSKYAQKIGSDVKILGVPKTIDNDLPVTDHTPGFGSAAKYIATTCEEIYLDSSVYNTDSVTIIEIMGRNAGWLTASSYLARKETPAPHLIYLPENVFDEEEFLNDIKELLPKHRNLIVCVSEGIKDKSGDYICEKASSGLFDAFGHKNLSGTGKVLENLVRERLNIKVRSVELNVCQRCAGHLLSKTDITESLQIGHNSLIYALMGETAKMTAIKRIGNNPYESETSICNIESTANLEKTFPLKWIISSKELSKEALEYLAPLIEGEVKVNFDLIPKYIKR